MRHSPWLRLAYYGTLALILLLLTFQLVLNLSRPEVRAQHTKTVRAIKGTLQGRAAYEFAVVGEVNNSVRTFQDQILPEINASDARFLVSAGNFLSDGSEEAYRAAHNILEQLQIPFVLTYGPNEDSAFGSFRFYERFGPYFYSFTAGNAHFIFLDLTGKTPFDWQVDWLRRELSTAADHHFVFTGEPLREPTRLPDLAMSREPVLNADQREQLRGLLASQSVSAVFSAGNPIMDQQQPGSIPYVITGGAGGLIIDDENSFHHYVRVSVTGDSVRIAPIPVEIWSSPWLSTLDSVFSAAYTFFYVSYARFLIILSLLIALGLKLHALLFTERDYYRRFVLDTSAEQKKPKRIAFFSNNYFPFVSGVTLSIERLRAGLARLGHSSLIVAPTYDRQNSGDAAVIRLKSLWSFGQSREFRLGNLFSWRLRRRIKEFRPDLIHVHHPFWLGWLGLYIGRRLAVPVVYTYHTRLEQYAHYVPLPGPVFRNFISHLLVKRFCNKCQGVIVPTVSVEEYLRAIGVRVPILVQPTGIDFESFSAPDPERVHELRQAYGVHDDRPVLITVSRLGREKNLDFILDAMARLKTQTDQAFRLLMVGQGDQQEHLARRIEQEGLSDTVCLTGALAPQDMGAMYQLADAFVFASKSETQGMVLLEAMAAGLPVVAVRSSGIDDVIYPDKNGYKTREDLNEWVDRVQQLIADDALRAQLGSAAQRFAESYDTLNFSSNINVFYSEVIVEQRAEKAPEKLST